MAGWTFCAQVSSCCCLSSAIAAGEQLGAATAAAATLELELGSRSFSSSTAGLFTAHGGLSPALNSSNSSSSR
jgi:hypothetical protein